MCLSVWHLDRASDKTLMLGQPPTSLETDFAHDGGVAASARSSEPCLHQIASCRAFSKSLSNNVSFAIGFISISSFPQILEPKEMSESKPGSNVKDLNYAFSIMI